jgi:hypothetical protein
MNTKNCECCLSQYATGKNYGDFHCVVPKHTEYTPSGFKIETPKGLCEFCNPNPDNIWYIKNLKCHNVN